MAAGGHEESSRPHWNFDRGAASCAAGEGRILTPFLAGSLSGGGRAGERGIEDASPGLQVHGDGREQGPFLPAQRPAASQVWLTTELSVAITSRWHCPRQAWETAAMAAVSRSVGADAG